MDKLYKSIYGLRPPKMDLRYDPHADIDIELLDPSIEARGLELGGRNCLTRPITITGRNRIVDGIYRWCVLKLLDKKHPNQGFDRIWCSCRITKEHPDEDFN